MPPRRSVRPRAAPWTSSRRRPNDARFTRRVRDNSRDGRRWQTARTSREGPLCPHAERVVMHAASHRMHAPTPLHACNVLCQCAAASLCAHEMSVACTPRCTARTQNGSGAPQISRGIHAAPPRMRDRSAAGCHDTTCRDESPRPFRLAAPMRCGWNLTETLPRHRGALGAALASYRTGNSSRPLISGALSQLPPSLATRWGQTAAC